MAKPGSNGARQLNARAVDLSRQKTLANLTDEEAREVQEQLEHELGMRCNGCGRRIRLGHRFTSIDPRAGSPVIRLYACSRDDCDFAMRCQDGATFAEPWGPFAWFDENGADAPASLAVVRRNEQMAREQAAAEKPDG